MRRVEGTSARQLDLWEAPASSPRPGPPAVRPKPLRLLQKDVYAELARRRRRAQIRARHLIE